MVQAWSGGLLAVVLSTAIGTSARAARDWIDLRSFSDEDSLSVCPRGYAVAGIRCSGDRCDNESLRCKRYGSRGTRPASRCSDWLSEEQRDGEWSDSEFVAGLA